MALYSFFKATASASRRSPSLLLLQHSRRFTSAAYDGALLLTNHELLSPDKVGAPAANSYGCLPSNPSAYTAYYGQISAVPLYSSFKHIVFPSMLRLQQIRHLTHTSASASPALLQHQLRRFASKSDGEPIHDEPEDPSTEEYEKFIEYLELQDDVNRFKEDVNRMYSNLEKIKKIVDEIEKTMKNNDIEYERHNSTLQALNDFKEDWDEEVQAQVLAIKADRWGKIFLTRFRRARVFLNFVVLLTSFTIGLFLQAFWQLSKAAHNS